MIVFFLIASLYYVDQPYLGVPQHAEFDIELRFGPVGEIIGFFNVGVVDRFSFGVSYGASNLIGAGDPEFYEIPGVQVRILAIQENFTLPKVILGFDNQGYGGYDGTRYTIRSKGIYCQFGKTFSYPGIEFVPSLGMNYCFEGENQFDLYGAVQTLFGSGTALLIEYSPNINDDLDQNKGYLNTGLRFIFYEQLFFEFSLRDLLDNGEDLADMQLNRMIKIGYEQFF